MSEPIKVGDLVQVIKQASCGCHEHLGHVFVVEEVLPAWADGYCTKCRRTIIPSGEMVAAWPDWGYTELSRLKRIPPLSELESEKNKEELTA